MKKIDTNVSDSKLAQLCKVLNESYMRDFFQNHFFNDRDERILQCQIVKASYKPGKRCLVAYALNFAHTKKQQVLFSQIHNTEKLKWQQGLLQTTGALFVPELEMLLWEFPHDPNLRSLAELTNTKRIPQLIPKILDPNTDDNGQHWKVKVQSLKYVPLKRFVLAVEIKNLSDKKETKILAKVYSDPRGAAVFDVMRQLWAQQARLQKAFRVVEPLEYESKRGTLWQRWSPGETFTSFARNKGLTFACSQIAKGLADLHQSRLKGLLPFSRKDQLEKLQGHTDLLIKFQHGLQAQLSRLLARLQNSAVLQKPVVKVPIHGDFNASQILFEDEKPVVIDFDYARRGDPLYDLANFIAELHLLNGPDEFTVPELMDAIRLFWRTYQERVPWKVSEDALRGQVAAALIYHRAFKVLRRLEMNTLQKIKSYLDLADHYLDGRTKL